jgi:hypothetical protein
LKRIGFLPRRREGVFIFCLAFCKKIKGGKRNR